MQTGEAHFTFPVPYEQAEVLKGKSDLEVVAAPSIVLRYLSMNTQQKPFDNPKVRQAIAYAINKEALAKVAFNGYATPAEGIAPQGVEYAVKIGQWPYDLAKAKELMKEAGYPSGFETDLWSAYNHTTAQKVTQFLQQQLQKIGIRTKITLLEAVQRVESRNGRIRRRPRAPVPCRLVDIDRRSGLGAASASLRRILAAQTVQHRVLQEPEGRRRHQGCTAHDRRCGKSETLQRGAGNDLDGCALGASGRREAALCKQQEAQRGLRDSGRIVQFYRSRSEALNAAAVAARAQLPPASRTS
jgi:hypothetical protein